MQQLEQYCHNLLQGSNCDAVAVATVDFAQKSFKEWQFSKLTGQIAQDHSSIYYDLASVSKPLTLSLGYFSNPQIVDQQMMLLLNHRGGLPAWGLLPKQGWQQIIKSYPIKESETLYSDYSALRFMLEYNAKSPAPIHQVCAQTWDEQLCFWKQLPKEAVCLQYGYQGGKPNIGVVHDPNARVIDDYVGHAGLFATIGGVARTLLNFNNKFQLLDKVSASIETDRSKQRFQLGWDTISDVNDSLAGIGCSTKTFGHLGFTGTSVWIDPEKKLGVVILTNAVKHYWYDKEVLNIYRRKIGSLVWQLPTR